MKNYKKTFFKHYGYSEGDWIGCMLCGSTGTEIHHAKYKSQGGTDDIDNLISLCRPCHNKCHFKQEPYIQYEEIKSVIEFNLNH